MNAVRQPIRYSGAGNQTYGVYTPPHKKSDLNHLTVPLPHRNANEYLQ